MDISMIVMMLLLEGMVSTIILGHLTGSITGAIAASIIVSQHSDSPQEYTVLTDVEQYSTVCRKCYPGTYLVSHCASSSSSSSAVGLSQCDACPSETYSPDFNTLTQCLACTQCRDSRSFEMSPCTRTSDRQCRCEEGWYWNGQMCQEHSHCPAGFGVKQRGSRTSDTVCAQCQFGTYSSDMSAVEPCRRHTQCKESWVIIGGTATRDAECGLQETQPQTPHADATMLEPPHIDTMMSEHTDYSLDVLRCPRILLALIICCFLFKTCLYWQETISEHRNRGEIRVGDERMHCRVDMSSQKQMEQHSHTGAHRSQSPKKEQPTCLDDEEKPLSRLEELCDEFMDRLERIRPLQGYYYDPCRQQIVLHVTHGYTGEVLEAIKAIYPHADFLSQLRMVEKTSDAVLQSGRLTNGCRITAPVEAAAGNQQLGVAAPGHSFIQADPENSDARQGTLTGVFEDGHGRRYVLTALHVFTGDDYYGCYARNRDATLHAHNAAAAHRVSDHVRGIRGNYLYGRRRHYVDIAAIPLDLPMEWSCHYKGLPRHKRLFSMPTAVNHIVVDSRVEKYGATSGHTTGRIVNNNYYQKIQGQFYSGMIVVCSDNDEPFTRDGDSGALVTGIDDGHAYAVHMSLDKDHEHLGQHFPASIMCRLDTSLQLLSSECGLSLDMVACPPSHRYSASEEDAVTHQMQKMSLSTNTQRNVASPRAAQPGAAGTQGTGAQYHNVPPSPEIQQAAAAATANFTRSQSTGDRPQDLNVRPSVGCPQYLNVSSDWQVQCSGSTHPVEQQVPVPPISPEASDSDDSNVFHVSPPATPSAEHPAHPVCLQSRERAVSWHMTVEDEDSGEDLLQFPSSKSSPSLLKLL